MPNYVTNVLTVNGPEERIKAFKQLTIIKDEDNETVFDFNKICPMPESLNMVDGGNKDEAIIAYLTNNCEKELTDGIKATAEMCGCTNMFDENYTTTVYQRVKETFAKKGKDALYSFSASGSSDGGSCEMTLFDAGKVYVNNVMLYGYPTWYDWRLNRWGTKWGAMNTCIDDEDDDYIRIIFDTAWSTPDLIIKQCGRLFPDLYFNCMFADEDFGSNTGEYEVNGDKFEQTVCFESYCKESQEFAAEILGFDLGPDGNYVYDEESGCYIWNED